MRNESDAKMSCQGLHSQNYYAISPCPNEYLYPHSPGAEGFLLGHVHLGDQHVTLTRNGGAQLLILGRQRLAVAAPAMAVVELVGGLEE